MKYTAPASVLCIEADARARECLSGALAEYECSIAMNACDALRALHARPFDAYVLDYWLPDWSGPLLCREIRKHDPHVAVLFCSEAMSDLQRGRALRAGANGYVAKPIEPPELMKELRGLVKFAASESTRAADFAKRALHEELARRGVAADNVRATAEALARLGSTAASIERTARARAYKAFIEAGGSRAPFERWWAEHGSLLFVSEQAVA